MSDTAIDLLWWVVWFYGGCALGSFVLTSVLLSPSLLGAI